MGIYYEIKKVIEHGERIGFAPQKQPSEIGENVLVGIMNNGVFAIAPDLTEESEYQHFYNSYEQGNWLYMNLYKVSKNKIKDCLDGGRVSIKELEQILKTNSSEKNP